MATVTASSVDSSTADREIVQERMYDAPRELVFRALTERQHVDHWWGPDGFINTTYEMDVRPGGRWRFNMHAPDGTDYSNRMVYQEVVAPERIVAVHGEDVDDDPNAFLVTITLEEVAPGQTYLRMSNLLNTVEQRAFVEGFGAVELGRQTLARLAEYLPKM